jgi:hypothetical protein
LAKKRTTEAKLVPKTKWLREIIELAKIDGMDMANDEIRVEVHKLNIEKRYTVSRR